MTRLGPCILLMFAFGLGSSLTGGTSDTIDVLLNNSTAVSAPPENILDFLEEVKRSAIKIQRDIFVESNEMSYLKRSKNEFKGVSLNDFLFSASIVRESAAKVLSLANNIRSKIETIETEKNLRIFASRLVAGGNRTSLDNWIERKSGEITEAVINLNTQYAVLSTSYQSHLSNVGVLRRRLAVVDTYNLQNSEEDNDDPVTSICRNGMFRCGNEVRNITCVKYCNGHSECGDHSDEPPGCNNQFGLNCPGAFRCDDGQCISLDFRCQSPLYCSDGSHMHYCME